jgi:hypothetical protein
MKKGVKLIGNAGMEAVLAELKQLHDHSMLEPKSTGSLSWAHRQAALPYLTFLKQKQKQKQKQNRIIKGLQDRQKQWECTAKED